VFLPFLKFIIAHLATGLVHVLFLGVKQPVSQLEESRTSAG